MINLRGARIAGPGRLRSGRSSRGAVSIETVLLIPALVLVIGVMVGGWRLWAARSTLDQASHAAARAATAQGSAAQAQRAADRVLRENLRLKGLTCDDLSRDVDTAAFASPPGSPGQVRVSVRCRIGLADLVAPLLPGSWTVSATGSETLDRYRERRP